MDIYKLTSPKLKSAACAKITEQLPAWFGIPVVNLKYIEDAKIYPAVAAGINNRIVGLLVYKEIYDEAKKSEITDIHWLGVLPDYHRKGIGRRLVLFLKEHMRHDILTVETLDPAVKDKNYLKTFHFYKGLGFNIYESFKYSDGTQMVKMYETIDRKP